MSGNSVWSGYYAEYILVLPDEKQLAEELNRTRRMLEARGKQKSEAAR